jgi:endonuclease/exonuclease/phosphatase family metal-dependent hydrolase
MHQGPRPAQFDGYRRCMRIATFNVMGGRSLRDGAVVPDRLAAAVAALDADVVGLQEIDRGQERSGYADQAAVAAQAMGTAHYRFVPAVIGTPGFTFRSAVDTDTEDGAQFGVALLSRWPVLEWQTTRLPGAPVRSPVVVPGPRGVRVILLRDEPRVLLSAIVDAPSGPMTVATTHLSFVPGWNVRQLRRAIRVLRELPPPRLLLADLNLPGGLAARLSGWLTLARRPTYPSPAPRVQFDHVLLDPNGASALPPVFAVDTPSVEISDHLPLTVTLAG